MKTFYKILTVVMVVVSLLIVGTGVGLVVSPKIYTVVSAYVEEKTDPKFVEWVEYFQNQVAVIAVGNERERLESRLNDLKKTELILEYKISTEGPQTPRERLIHGDYENALKKTKASETRTKLSLFWVKTKDKLKFW